MDSRTPSLVTKEKEPRRIMKSLGVLESQDVVEFAPTRGLSQLKMKVGSSKSSDNGAVDAVPTLNLKTNKALERPDGVHSENGVAF